MRAVAAVSVERHSVFLSVMSGFLSSQVARSVMFLAGVQLPLKT